jgi:hypothetical protein
VGIGGECKPRDYRQYREKSVCEVIGTRKVVGRIAAVEDHDFIGRKERKQSNHRTSAYRRKGRSSAVIAKPEIEILARKQSEAQMEKCSSSCVESVCLPDTRTSPVDALIRHIRSSDSRGANRNLRWCVHDEQEVVAKIMSEKYGFVGRKRNKVTIK